MTIEYIIYIVAGVWLLALSVVLFWTFKIYRRLTKDVKRGDLVKVLTRVLETEAKNTKSINQILKHIKRIDEENLVNIQKVGLIRFNPFSELGGDHSFVIALLDGVNNGIILTGLHTRERTRVYLKEVKRAKAKLSLSKEEEKALSKALKG